MQSYVGFRAGPTVGVARFVRCSLSTVLFAFMRDGSDLLNVLTQRETHFNFSEFTTHITSVIQKRFENDFKQNLGVQRCQPLFSNVPGCV